MRVRLAIAIMALTEAFLHFGIVYSDSKSYIAFSRYVLGETHRVSVDTLSVRPLIPFLAALPSKYLGFPIGYGLVNTLLLVGSAFMVYCVAYSLTCSKSAAALSSFLLVTTLPTLLYFSSVMTETGGLFFQLLPIYLYLRFRNQEERPNSFLNLKRRVFVYSAYVLAGIGLLAREVTYLSAASLLLLALVDRRVKYAFTSLLAMVVPFLLYQNYIFITYGHVFVKTLIGSGFQYVEAKGLQHKIWDPEEIAKAFLLGHYPLTSIFLLVGLLLEEDRSRNLRYYAVLLPAVLGFLAWPFRDLRIASAMFYASLPIAGLGMSYFIKHLARKPLLNKFGEGKITAILILIQILLANLYTLRTFGRFSVPWDVYLFAPSSLRAGLE
jgi:hypothetical protein